MTSHRSDSAGALAGGRFFRRWLAFLLLLCSFASTQAGNLVSVQTGELPPLGEVAPLRALATVDGRPVVLWTANYAFQALEVPAGTHRVSVVFRSTSFEIGAILSALTALGCGAWSWRWRKQRTESSPAVLLRP